MDFVGGISKWPCPMKVAQNLATLPMSVAEFVFGNHLRVDCPLWLNDNSASQERGCIMTCLRPRDICMANVLLLSNKHSPSLLPFSTISLPHRPRP